MNNPIRNFNKAKKKTWVKSKAGTPELGGGQEGQPPPLPFTRRVKGGAKVPFQFKGLPCRNSEFSEIVSAISEL